ncbi:MAG: dNTP triphosphohydrolase [Candidatus Peribacteraceae bacterium]|nr:dNTP triphosphohydrolase [Candidatus Peribacteraceae bacterium]
MLPLSSRITQANSLLAPFAVPHGKGLGRVHPEPDDATRFPFQRDRDRILHTQAFRRLKHKTQVFVSGHGDHYRTRITHTLEVAQISRDIARTLGLNEDLAEAIALAHDLGHTPFGHAGEEAMAACMKPFGKTFEHNLQSFRIVTLLEDRSEQYQGLNLSQEILDGLVKHSSPHDRPTTESLPRSPSLEAQVVNIADEIAYTAHDTDDGLRAGQFSSDDVRTTKLGALASVQATKHGTELRGAIVHLLVSDLYEATGRKLATPSIRSLDDVYRSAEPLICFSTAMQTILNEHRMFLWNRLYLSASVQRQANRGKKIVTSLFRRFLKRPPVKVLSLQRKTGSIVEEAVKDYIAGMTDGFAIQENE